MSDKPGNKPISYYAESGTEHGHQVAVCVWASRVLNVQPLLRWLFAIPNGGERNPATASRLKAEGVKTGVPDLCLPVPRRNYAGLYIEMKKPGGTLSKAQKDDWIPFLTSQFYYVAVCYNYLDAIRCLEWYLEMEATVVD